MLFRKLRAKAAAEKQVPCLPPVDHSLAEAALASAVQTHQVAQEQKAEATQVVSELRKVNMRNGFAPAIVATVTNRFGGAREA